MQSFRSEWWFELCHSIFEHEKGKNYSNLSNKAKNIQKVPNYAHFGGIFGNSFPLQLVCCLFCSLKWLIFTTIHYNCNRIVKYIKIRTLGSIYIIKTSKNSYVNQFFAVFMLFTPKFWMFSSKHFILTIQMNSSHQNESIDMLESGKVGQISNIFEFGYFWHFLANFRIENGFLVTLLVSGHFNFMTKVHNV